MVGVVVYFRLEGALSPPGVPALNWGGAGRWTLFLSECLRELPVLFLGD